MLELFSPLIFVVGVVCLPSFLPRPSVTWHPKTELAPHLPPLSYWVRQLSQPRCACLLLASLSYLSGLYFDMMKI